MEFWLIIGSISLAGCLVLAIGKIFQLKAAIKQIGEQLQEKRSQDTNGLIRVSTRDRDVRFLASTLNQELKQLRKDQLRYELGDQQLKESITNISHDLRTPLTAISGYLELLESENQNPNTKRYLEIITARLEAMKDLTAELFSYSSLLPKLSNSKRMESTPINLKQVLENHLLGFYGALSERSIEPMIHLPGQDVWILGDQQSLERILSNLMSNVLKYSSGDLSINLDENGLLTYSNLAFGLDPLQIQQLFSRFYTVETNARSLGLGLSLAKELIEQMNGTIEAEYKEERLVIRLQFLPCCSPANSK